MKIIIIIFILISKVLLGSTTQISEIAEKDTFRVIVPLTAQTISTGTGFLINKGGYVITNNHVTEGNHGGIILKNNFEEYKDISLIKSYPKHDITILKINNYTKGTFLKLQNPLSIKKGQNIYPLGFPGGADILEGLTFNASLSGGLISKIDKATQGDFPPNYKLIQIDAVINHGNSGGPLLNENSAVVGINTLGNGSLHVQGIFWSIHIEELIKVLKENNIDYTIDNSELGTIVKTQMIWIVLAIFTILFILILTSISKRKNEVDEDEVSRLVRNKMKKYGDDTSLEEDEEYQEKFYKEEARGTHIIQKDEPKTHLIYITLSPKDPSLPTIKNIHKQELIVGSASSCDVVISNSLVSKEHLALIMIANTIEVIDLGSTNGTYIDNKKLNPHHKYTLKKENILMIGSEDIIYNLDKEKNQEPSGLFLRCEDNQYPIISRDGILGRDSSCDIQVNHTNVSRQHLKITFEDGIIITDLDSANGTYIDGNKIEPNVPTKLYKGNKLIIGSEDIIYGY